MTAEMFADSNCSGRHALWHHVSVLPWQIHPAHGAQCRDDNAPCVRRMIACQSRDGLQGHVAYAINTQLAMPSSGPGYLPSYPHGVQYDLPNMILLRSGHRRTQFRDFQTKHACSLEPVGWLLTGRGASDVIVATINTVEMTAAIPQRSSPSTKGLGVDCGARPPGSRIDIPRGDLDEISRSGHPGSVLDAPSGSSRKSSGWAGLSQERTALVGRSEVVYRAI